MTDSDALRRQVSAALDPKQRARLGQYMTPVTIARFMASLFPPSPLAECRLLDPGAGVGALSIAFLERWAAGGFDFRHLQLDAFEIDPRLRSYLKRGLAKAAGPRDVDCTVHADDFIVAAASSLAGDLFGKAVGPHTHVIMNPPYKKIRSDSAHRLALRQIGIETGNLYSAFVALALALLKKGGQLVAIIPRSFCNGPYYRPFRNYVLERAALRQMHLFNARNRAFRDDDVLQENIIIRLERDGRQGEVTVSTSTDDSFSDYTASVQQFSRVVAPDDPDRFIHVPNDSPTGAGELPPTIRYSLADLDLEVSTGPIVDFRLREYVRAMPEPGTVPLLYPGHFAGQVAAWPKTGFKKPNAIVRTVETEKWLFPSGSYTVVRRFSAKEEARRIVASVVDPKAFPGAQALGFENHLNVFHRHRQGIPDELARGLAVFLNTRALDSHFRAFSGHTQVNATDLRRLKYPSRATLMSLGKWARKHPHLEQAKMDEHLKALTS